MLVEEELERNIREACVSLRGGRRACGRVGEWAYRR